jgi:hypothetical protein
MSVRNAAGAIRTKAQVIAGATTIQTPSYVMDQNYYYHYRQPGEKAGPQGTHFHGFEASGRKLLFKSGRTYSAAQLDTAFPPATGVIAPNTGYAAAGGTAFTITGTNLDGCTGVTFGGTAATSYLVESPTRITGVAPAKTAGSVAVVLQDDAGNVALGNVTYV